MQPAAAKAIEAMPEEQQEEVIADDAEAIAAGEVSPEEAVEAVAEEAEEAEAAPGFSGIAKKFVDDLKGRGLSDEGETFIKAYLQNLKDSETFRQVAGTKLNMEESYFRGSVSSYLFEDIDSESIGLPALSVALIDIVTVSSYVSIPLVPGISSSYVYVLLSEPISIKTSTGSSGDTAL